MEAKHLRALRENIRASSLQELPSLRRTDEFLSNLPMTYFSSNRYTSQGLALQPRGGLSTVAKQTELWKSLITSGADILPLTIDSNTRQNDYAKASELHRIAIETGKDTLNGYPLVSEDLLKTREMVLEVSKPISLRHGTPDARLLVECALACGITEIEGGALCYSLPYSKNYPLELALSNWKYIDSVCAYYNREGVKIVRESFGPLTSTLVPPVISLLVQMSELRLALEQGVKHFSVSITQSGSLVQDIAAMSCLRRLSNKIKNDVNGCDDAQVYYVYHQWMGAFPIDRVQADQLLAFSNFCACLVKADKVILKTRDEAKGVPSLAANADAVKAAKYVRDKFCLQESKLLGGIFTAESEYLEKEVVALYEQVFTNNSLTSHESLYHAVRKGIIDVPFSPHVANAGLLRAKRVSDGSVRVEHRGNVPLSDEFLSREQQYITTEKDCNDELDSVVKMILHYADMSDIQ